jgi:hypothetical protein
MASAAHWNLKLLIRNAAKGVTRSRDRRATVVVGSEGASGIEDNGTAPESKSEPRVPDACPLEFPDPSATIDL